MTVRGTGDFERPRDLDGQRGSKTTDWKLLSLALHTQWKTERRGFHINGRNSFFFSLLPVSPSLLWAVSPREGTRRYQLSITVDLEQRWGLKQGLGVPIPAQSKLHV